MLAAYFDESGTHDQSKVVTVCGLVGTTVEWSRLERPWKQNLEALKVPCFHATDCSAGRKDFQGIDRPLRDSLSMGLSLAIADRQLAIIGGSVFREDWNNCATRLMKEAYGGDPYHLCFALALQQLSDWSERFAGGDPVALVFARQQQYNDYSEKILTLVNGSKHYQHIGSLSFSRPECVIPLQAADHVAYENYQELYAQLQGSDITAPVRENLKVLTRAIPYMSVFYDCEGLRQFGQQVDAAITWQLPYRHCLWPPL